MRGYEMDVKAKIADKARSFVFNYCDGDFNEQNEMYRALIFELTQMYNMGSWDGFFDGKATHIEF